MTGEQSRLLKPLDRVCWGATTTDLGTVIETAWNGVSINWDDGRTSSIEHNDMARIQRVKQKRPWQKSNAPRAAAPEFKR
jgi:hypothetical protein